MKPASPTGGEKHVELSGIHDFARKLLQPETWPQVKRYVQWRAGLEREIPDFASYTEGRSSE